ncbi:MAG: hypothetical protein CMB80_02830 [Flammeovirgaceae bacterium]|nr:hypothetical protein [Flammeovirgaceae bacterium]
MSFKLNHAFEIGWSKMPYWLTQNRALNRPIWPLNAVKTAPNSLIRLFQASGLKTQPRAILKNMI